MDGSAATEALKKHAYAEGDLEMEETRGRMGRTLVAIITIVDEEFDAVREIGNFTEFVGGTSYMCRAPRTDGEFDVILAKSADRGNTSCSELVIELAERFRPEYIILSGIAGGVAGRDGVELGDVIVADYVESYELRKLSDGKSQPRQVAIDHPSKFLRDTVAQRVRVDRKWQDRISVPRPDEAAPKVIVGNLIAGEKILGDGENQYQKEILQVFDKAVAVDMESHGLARSTYHARGTRSYNLNYLIVRGISDLVESENNNEVRKRWKHYAAATAAAFTMEVVDQLISFVATRARVAPPDGSLAE